MTVDTLPLLCQRQALAEAAGEVNCWLGDEGDRSTLARHLPACADTAQTVEPLTLYAPQLQAAKSLDFLTQIGAEQAQQQPLLRAWVPAAILLSLAGIIHGGVLLHEKSQLLARQAQIEQQVEHDFRAAFPQIKRLVDPLAQARQQFKSRAASTHRSDFPLLLNALAEGFSAEPQPRLQSLQYRNGQLDVRVSVGNLQRLEQLQSQIGGDGIEAHLQNADRGREQVTGLLRLKRVSS